MAGGLSLLLPFDVWIQSVGSNAANLPCTAVTTSAQSNCPPSFICYDEDVNTQYCVPGTTSSTTFPITSQSDITLDASQCGSGQLVTDTSSNLWGQCTCTKGRPTHVSSSRRRAEGQPVGGRGRLRMGIGMADQNSRRRSSDRGGLDPYPCPARAAPTP
jgi:hypothetical protein